MEEFDFGLPERPDEIDPGLRNALESRNAAYLSEECLSFLADAIGQPLQICRELILRFHGIAVRDIDNNAGRFREKEPILVSDHVPPKPREIDSLVDAMCEHVKRQDDPSYASAFILWRTCWIHPFTDGNGRVARVLAFICFCVTSNELLDAGDFFDQMLKREDEYYAALESADQKWARSDQDYRNQDVVYDLEMLILGICNDLKASGG